MSHLMRIAGYAVATLGVAYIVKQMKRRNESSRGWHKINVEGEEPFGATVSHEAKVKEEKRTGTRYGSNPIRY